VVSKGGQRGGPRDLQGRVGFQVLKGGWKSVKYKRSSVQPNDTKKGSQMAVEKSVSNSLRTKKE